MRFVQHNGLYIYDTGVKDDSNPIVENDNDSSTNLTTNDLDYNYLFVQTVEENIAQFTSRDVKAAQKARSLYRRLGRPSHNDFVRFLENNFIRNCDVTSADAKRALHIYGPDPAFIQGKTKRIRPPPVSNLPIIPVPDHILRFHNDITISIDIFYVNGLPFLHTISNNINFRTVEPLSNETYKTLLDKTYKVLNFYQARGFSINTIKADGQFECLEESLRPTHLYVSAAGEHVPEIERSVQTIEGDVRSMHQGLPFQTYPKLMLRMMVRQAVRLRNLFPSSTTSVHSTLGPSSIMTGPPMPDASYFSLEFGEYVQTHDHPAITNQIHPLRSTGAIALGPANHNGGWHFMSLSTGARILRYAWTSLPITHDVVQRVHQLANHQGSFSSLPENPLFEYAPGDPVFSHEGAHPPSSPLPASTLTHQQVVDPLIIEPGEPLAQDDTTEAAAIEELANNNDETIQDKIEPTNNNIEPPNTEEPTQDNIEVTNNDVSFSHEDLLNELNQELNELNQLETDFNSNLNQAQTDIDELLDISPTTEL
ncbi:MAG: hypothetical protein ACPGED_07120, partial [Flavobacteriales bacterium]